MKLRMCNNPQAPVQQQEVQQQEVPVVPAVQEVVPAQQPAQEVVPAVQEVPIVPAQQPVQEAPVVNHEEVPVVNQDQDAPVAGQAPVVGQAPVAGQAVPADGGAQPLAAPVVVKGKGKKGKKGAKGKGKAPQNPAAQPAQPPKGGKGVAGKGAAPAPGGKGGGVIRHRIPDEDEGSDSSSEDEVRATSAPGPQSSKKTWDRIQDQCDSDWEDDYKKYESGPKQRNVAKEQREAKDLFENGKITEEECIALYRLSKVDIADIAKPSKAHSAQLKTGLRTSSKGKTYLSDTFFKQVLRTWGGQIFLNRWPDVKSRASQDALLIAWWNLAREGLATCDEKAILFPRTTENCVKQEALDLIKTIISLRERQQIDILISPISRKYPFNTLKLMRCIYHLAAHDCAVIAPEDWAVMVSKEYQYKKITEFMIDATPPIMNAIYLAGVMDVSEAIRTRSDRTRAAFANTTVPFEVTLVNTITIQPHWKVAARSLTEAFVRALLDAVTPVFVTDPRLLQKNIITAWEEGLRGVAKDVATSEFKLDDKEYGGGAVTAGPSGSNGASASRVNPYGDTYQQQNDWQMKNDWGSGGWKPAGDWKPKNKSNAALTFTILRNIKAATGCNCDQLACPFGASCSYKTSSCRWCHDPESTTSFKIKDVNVPEAEIVRKAKEFLKL